MKNKKIKYISKVNPILQNYVKSFKTGTVLDAGCADGSNAIFLAQNGFKVTAIDNDKDQIQKLVKNAKTKNTNLNVLEEDLNNYQLNKKYDNIVCTYVLHFLPKQNAKQLITTFKENTNQKGVNFIQAFTNKGEKKINAENMYLVKNDLLSYYKDWNIIFYKKYIGLSFSGLKQQRAVIIAKKP